MLHFLKDKEQVEIDGQWRGMDGIDRGKEDFSVQVPTLCMPLTIPTCLGDCRCSRLERGSRTVA